MNQPNWRSLKKAKRGFSMVQKHSLRRNSNEKTGLVVQQPKPTNRKKPATEATHETKECEAHAPSREAGPDEPPKDRSYLIQMSENIPYVNLGKDLGELDKDLARFFMAGSTISDRATPQTELIASFCSGDTVEELKTCSTRMGSECIALIDDRTNDGKSSIARAYLGPLNAHRLYLELAEERFPLHQFDSTEKLEVQSSNPVPNRGGSQLFRLNADRRLIFITNLNRWAVMALILTASEQQAWALRESLYRHLAFRASVCRMIPSHGLAGFQMAFDLPYFALSREKPIDDRKTSAGPIRNLMDVSFLVKPGMNLTPGREMSYLCNVQISVLVAGTDNSKWVAYCFVDTYFEHEDDKESVDDYCSYIGYEKDAYPDPFTAGQTSSSPPVLNPTEYFLVVLEFRIRQVKSEWEAVVIWLRCQIETYVQSCPITGLGVVCLKPTGNLDSVKRSRHWVVRTKMLLFQVSKALTDTLSQWESAERERLLNPTTTLGARCLGAVRVSFKQLDGVSKDFDALRRICDEYDSCLLFHLNHEGGQNAKVQARIAQFGLIMTVVMLCVFSPIALAASILSMEPSAIPAPLGPNSTSFLVLASVFSCIVWLVVGIMLKWDRVCSIRGFGGSRAVNSDLESSLHIDIVNQ